MRSGSMDSVRKIKRLDMTFLTSLAVVLVAAIVGAWVNDNTELGGNYMSDE